MKRIDPSDDSNRFRSNTRHHRRSGTQTESLWDQAIGTEHPTHRRRNWLSTLGIVVSILALVGLAVALYLELR